MIQTVKHKEHETVVINTVKYLFKHQTVCHIEGCDRSWMLYIINQGATKFVARFDDRDQVINYLEDLTND